jgi:hypothetical protein
LKDASINKALEQNLTLSERARLEGLRERNAKDIADAQIRMHLQTAQLIHAASGAAGVGTWSAVGNDPDTGAQVFHNSKTNQLVTSDAHGQPVPYTKSLGPKPGTGAGSSEDERKGASWLAQAENAKANASKVLLANPGASKPGLAESMAGWVPGKIGDDLANAMRSGDRQQFMQAASSFSEAALRMATGAGMSENEARQKVNELTPRMGDKPGVIQQKLASWDSYMQEFKLRAGRAASGVPGAAAGGGDSHPEGSTATGPGGARVIKRNGQWVPA